MKSKLSAEFAVALTIATATILCVPVQATTVTFSDEYYVTSSTKFHSIFGAGTTGFGGAGIYQVTNTATPIVTRLGNGSRVPGEYVQNTNPNLNEELALFGWSQSLNNGQQVADVYNAGSPENGSTYFQYTMGGATTPFSFNGFDLRGFAPTANLSFTLEGFLGGTSVYTAVLNVTGNTYSTFTENWMNVDTVRIVSTTSLPVAWGSGTLYMDNIVINDPISVRINNPISPTPEPGTLLLLGSSLVGLAALTRSFRKAEPTKRR